MLTTAHLAPPQTTATRPCLPARLSRSGRPRLRPLLDLRRARPPRLRGRRVAEPTRIREGRKEEPATVGVLAHTEPLPIPSPQLEGAGPSDDATLAEHATALGKELVQQRRPVSGPVGPRSKSTEPPYRSAGMLATKRRRQRAHPARGA